MIPQSLPMSLRASSLEIHDRLHSAHLHGSSLLHARLTVHLRLDAVCVTSVLRNQRTAISGLFNLDGVDSTLFRLQPIGSAANISKNNALSKFMFCDVHFLLVTRRLQCVVGAERSLSYGYTVCCPTYAAAEHKLACALLCAERSWLEQIATKRLVGTCTPITTSVALRLLGPLGRAVAATLRCVIAR